MIAAGFTGQKAMVMRPHTSHVHGDEAGRGGGIKSGTVGGISERSANYALTLATAISRPAARDESSARRAIAQPAPTGVNTNRTPVAAG